MTAATGGRSSRLDGDWACAVLALPRMNDHKLSASRKRVQRRSEKETKRCRASLTGVRDDDEPDGREIDRVCSSSSKPFSRNRSLQELPRQKWNTSVGRDKLTKDCSRVTTENWAAARQPLVGFSPQGGARLVEKGRRLQALYGVGSQQVGARRSVECRRVASTSVSC